ncbi:MAG: hypothetical protein NTW48_00645 [Chloroflexi bacterium]|nr:hypothetical protein [Chloroflexota bacterium]
MFDKKWKFAVLFIAILLVLGLTLPACTCQKPTETEKPPASPGQQAETEGPSAPPEQQAETEKPSALSFEAAEYTNAEFGFSVKYPKDWKEATAISGPGILFVAQAPAQVPVLLVSVSEGATLVDALTAAVEGTGGSDVNIKSQSETTLSDGTKATQGTGKFKHPIAPMAIDAFVLGAMKDNKWIIVTVATVGLLAKYDEAKFSEIAHTLEFK